MESPQTRVSKPSTGEPERPFTRPEPGAARRALPALPALHNYGADWQHPSPAADHALCSRAPSLKSFQCVSCLMCASLRLASLAWCGLSALGSDSQIHSHSDLPLGAVWDQRLQTSQQQVLHFYSLFHLWGLSQSQRRRKALRAGQMLLRWSAESMRL